MAKWWTHWQQSRRVWSTVPCFLCQGGCQIRHLVKLSQMSCDPYSSLVSCLSICQGHMSCNNQFILGSYLGLKSVLCIFYYLFFFQFKTERRSFLTEVPMHWRQKGAAQVSILVHSKSENFIYPKSQSTTIVESKYLKLLSWANGQSDTARTVSWLFNWYLTWINKVVVSKEQHHHAKTSTSSQQAHFQLTICLLMLHYCFTVWWICSSQLVH